MLKKIILFSFLFLFFTINNVSATWTVKDLKVDLKTSNETEESKKRNEECEKSWECFDKDNFIIDTQKFTLWWKSFKKDWVTSKESLNFTLWTIIQKLMIGLWIIALLVMSVWAWYMIIYTWHDEHLSKWKNIFIWWITSLVIALSSYYIVNFITYIIYNK